jgi:hypothetical protein
VFEIEQKLKARDQNPIERNLKRIYHEFEEMGYKIIDPINRPYKETDTDIEASVAGDFKENMVVSRVLKPIIYRQGETSTELVQKGIVLVG